MSSSSITTRSSSAGRCTSGGEGRAPRCARIVDARKLGARARLRHGRTSIIPAWTAGTGRAFLESTPNEVPMKIRSTVKAGALPQEQSRK